MKSGDLTLESVAGRLRRAGWPPAANALCGAISVVELSRRNRNYVVRCGDAIGLVLKQRRADHPADLLRHEAEFYAACARGSARLQSLPVPTAYPSLARKLSKEGVLALALVPHTSSLWEFRRSHADASPAYRNLGRALGRFHSFAASDAFQRDRWVRSLEALPHWVLSIHRPSPRSVQHLSSAQIEVLRIVQEAPHLGRALDDLWPTLEPSTVVHGDLKADNVLVSTDDPGARVTLVDWESAGRGDPAWDVGAVFEDVLTHGLQTLAPRREVGMESLIAENQQPMRLAHEWVRAFWRAYVIESGIADDARERLLRSAVMCSVAHLVERAYEQAQSLDTLPNLPIAMLQAADNIAAAPADAALLVYGLPLAPRRRR